MTDTNNPKATVQRMLQAFNDRDLDALIETVHVNSRWVYIGANPRLSKGEIIGPDGVRRFFEGIYKRLEVTEFNTDEFIEQEDTVVIFGSEAGKVRATGQPFRNEWAQKYVVKNNKITDMAEYNIQVEPRV